MNCGEFRESINEYFSGALPQEVNRVMQEHMQCCENCAMLEREYRQALNISGELSPGAPETAKTHNLEKSADKKRLLLWGLAALLVLTLGAVAFFVR